MVAVLDLDGLKNIIIPCLVKLFISLLGDYGVRSLKFCEEYLKGGLSIILLCQSLNFRYGQVALFDVLYISTKEVSQFCPYCLVIHGITAGINPWCSLSSYECYIQEVEYHFLLTSNTELLNLNCYLIFLC